MLAGLLFLLCLTGGGTSNHSTQSDLLVNQQKSNYSLEGSGSGSNFSEPPDPITSEENGIDHDYDEFGLFIYKGEKVNCTERDVYNYLDLTNATVTRPGKMGSPTEVKLDVYFAAILDVNEKDQKFVSSLWITMRWYDTSLKWDRHDFCGIYGISLPATLVWTPDLTIEEMIKTETTQPSPYVWIDWDGEIYLKKSVVVTSTCKMEVYKFPFDVQNCSLSFKSIIHSASHVLLKVPSWTKHRTSQRMGENGSLSTGSEWKFMNLTTINKTWDDSNNYRSVLVYTITMERRSVLYIANFLLPVLFFFCLDLASFLISDARGEKLSFKVTVLLAVTVMQLILNEILPTTSDRVPFVAVYCIGMFGLMMTSLIETILVIYLMEKDIEADEPKSEDCEDKKSNFSFCSSSKELKKWTPCACVCDVSTDEPPSELLSATKEVKSSNMMEESIALEKLSGELKEVILLLNNREEAIKIGYWTRVAIRINKVFFIIYITFAAVFLVVTFSLWHT